MGLRTFLYGTQRCTPEGEYRTGSLRKTYRLGPNGSVDGWWAHKQNPAHDITIGPYFLPRSEKRSISLSLCKRSRSTCIFRPYVAESGASNCALHRMQIRSDSGEGKWGFLHSKSCETDSGKRTIAFYISPLSFVFRGRGRRLIRLKSNLNIVCDEQFVLKTSR